MNHKKTLVLCLAVLMVLANILSLMPVRAFAQETVDAADQSMMELVPAEKIIPEENADTTEEGKPSEEVKGETADAPVEESTDKTVAPETAEDTQEKAEAESNGMNKADWEYTEDKGANTITLTKYKGTSKHVVIPGRMEGMQVRITKFPCAPAPKTATMTEEEASIVSVTFKAAEDGTKVIAADYSPDAAPRFGVENVDNGVNDQLTTLDVSGLDVTGWTDLNRMFYNRRNLATIIGLEQWNVSSAQTMTDVFKNTGFAGIDQLAGWDVSHVTNTSGMFAGTGITTLAPLANWKMENVITAANMFAGCKGITDLSPIAGWKLTSINKGQNGVVAKFGGVYRMFADTSVADVSPLNQWDVSKVISLAGMFYGTQIKTANLPDWKLTNAQYLYEMFAKTPLEDTTAIKSWDVSKVTDMQGMFAETQLKDTTAIKDWNVSSVTNMQKMFANTPLVFADLSGWKLNAKVNNTGMFDSTEKKPLLVVTKDTMLKGYKFAADNREAVGPTFMDGDTVVGNPQKIFVIENTNIDTAKAFVEAEKNKIQAPQKPNMDFVKWQPKAEGKTVYEVLSTVFEAVYKTKEFTVTFDTEIPGATPETKKVPVGSAIPVPSVPTYKDYIFAGWEVTAGPAELLNREWNFVDDMMPASDITLTAIWTDQVYVEFEYNGGTAVNDESGYYQFGTKLPEPQNVTNGDLVLVGWYTDADCTDEWDFNVNVVPKHDMTLYAKWAVKMGTVNHVPTIDAKDVTLTVGQTFDPLAGVTAHDNEDGDIVLTDKNVIKNDVKMDAEGVYQVTYSVTDKTGATVQKTITVTVKAATAPVEPTEPSKPTEPTKPNKPNNTPNTGDMSSLGMMSSMFVASAGALAVLLRKKNKVK